MKSVVPWKSAIYPALPVDGDGHEGEDRDGDGEVGDEVVDGAVRSSEDPVPIDVHMVINNVLTFIRLLITAAAFNFDEI